MAGEQGANHRPDAARASFRIEKGQATTSDLNLVGPLVRMTGAGTIDLAAKSLAFRVEPKLVMTTEGQGRAVDPVGLGIPVVIDGPWSEPRIYPDMAGILDQSGRAYAKLKEMGKGLFGNDGGLSELGGVGPEAAATTAVRSARRPAWPNPGQSDPAESRASAAICEAARPARAAPPATAPRRRATPSPAAGQPADERCAEAVVQSLSSHRRSACPPPRPKSELCSSRRRLTTRADASAKSLNLC